ncbi:NYN domain-containing protein [Streptomyces sp. NPDC050504]|uniref:NYN domain-containing protein n=1 Tax=Streptomyces sp. NPDC050504 TaxID=3365618 RepID=UPI0037B193E2
MANPATDRKPRDTAEAAADVVRHGRWWSRWPDWSAPLAVVWSALYGAAMLYWALGGEGYPFQRVHEDRSSGSLLEPSRADVVAPVLALFCAAAVVVGVTMLRGRGTGGGRGRVVAFGWTAACVLMFLIPDYSLLGLLVFSPVLLVFAFTGVPGPQELGDILYWHRINIIFVFVGGLLWAAATLAHQRRSAGLCVRCGRGPHGAAAWTRPDRALRWGRVAVYTAVLSTLPYDITRIAWYFGWPLGISDAFLKDMQDTPHMLEMGLALGVASTLGSLLMHGLVCRWGEVWPRWVWFKKGRPVHPATAIVPASVVAVVLIPAGLMAVRGVEADSWGTMGPAIFWVVWGVALGAATLLYYVRRRGSCGECGRG